jgi:hypothetical protein
VAVLEVTDDSIDLGGNELWDKSKSQFISPKLT